MPPGIVSGTILWLAYEYEYPFYKQLQLPSLKLHITISNPNTISGIIIVTLA